MAEIDTRWRGERRVVVTVETTRPQIYVTAVGAQGLAGPPGPIGPEGPKGDPTGVWVRGGLPPLPEPPPDYNPLWVDLDDDEDSSWTDIYPQLDLRIGTVAESATQASAEIVGEAPDKILNLVLRTGSEGASAGVLTSKGDLLSRDASKAVRVPVGTAGQVLTADPAAAAGVAWKALNRGEWESVATWAALPASGNWPGRRVKVLDGLAAAGAVGLVAVWDGTRWQVDPVSDTGWWPLPVSAPWTASISRIRRRGHSVEVQMLDVQGATTWSKLSDRLVSGFNAGNYRSGTISREDALTGKPIWITTIGAFFGVYGGFVDGSAWGSAYKFSTSFEFMSELAWPTTAP